MYVCVRERVCVCVCVRARVSIHTYILYICSVTCNPSLNSFDIWVYTWSLTYISVNNMISHIKPFTHLSHTTLHSTLTYNPSLNSHIQPFTQLSDIHLITLYTHTRKYICVCVCLCVCGCLCVYIHTYNTHTHTHTHTNTWEIKSLTVGSAAAASTGDALLSRPCAVWSIRMAYFARRNGPCCVRVSVCGHRYKA